MPLYEFKCPKCGLIREEVLTMAESPSVGTECPQFACPDCALPTVRIFSTTQGVVVKYSQEVYHKNPRRHLEKIQEVMDEPLTTSEIREGKAMLAEREKKLNKPEGTLTTGRQAPKTKEEFDKKVAPVAKRRAAESRQARGEKSWT